MTSLCRPLPESLPNHEQQGQQPELVERLKLIQKMAMRAVMKKNLQS